MRFKARGGLGDEFAFTALVREAKKFMPDELIRVVNPRYPDVWLNNPRVNHGNGENGKFVRLQMQLNEDKGNIPTSFGIQAGIPMTDTQPELFLTSEERMKGHYLLAKHGALKRSVIAIDSGANWPSRQWMPERWHELGERLSKWASVVEIGVPGGDHFGWQKHTEIPGARKLLNLPIRESAAVLAASDLYIGNDSGCFHMAAAVGTPQVIVFGVKGPKCLAYRDTTPVEGSRPCDVGCAEMCRRKRKGYVMTMTSEEWEHLDPIAQESELQRRYHFCMEDIRVDQVEATAKGVLKCA